MSFDDQFEPAIRRYLSDITEKEPPLLAHIRQQIESDSRLPRMSIGPIEGQFLKFLVTLSRPKRLLEIGTFLGYSALYLASALPADGELITCEKDSEYAKRAQYFFDLSPDAHKIKLLVGNAFEALPSLPGQFDAIFLDANQSQYPKFYETCVDKLKPGGWMVVDNALWRGEVTHPNQSKYATAINTFNQKAKDDPRLETVLLTVRDGLLLLYKR